MSETLFLERKIKKSPVCKIVKERMYEKVKHLDNKIYQVMKKRKDEGYSFYDSNFERQIESAISKKAPLIVSKQSLSRPINQSQRANSASPKFQQKHYQTTTLSFDIKNIKRAQSVFLNYEHNHKKDSEKSISKTINLKFPKKTVKFCQRLEKVKKLSHILSEDIQVGKKRLNIATEVNNRINQHFSELVIDCQSIDQIDINSGERHKFSSNNLLQNILTKKDEEVRDWIEKQKHSFLRKKGAKAIYYHEMTTKDIKNYANSLLKKEKLNQIDIKQLEKQIKKTNQKINYVRIEKEILQEKNQNKKCLNGFEIIKQHRRKRYMTVKSSGHKLQRHSTFTQSQFEGKTPHSHSEQKLKEIQNIFQNPQFD